jgi:hypothetical protein
VAQLDPVTGAILHRSPGLDSLDGLTYDSRTGLLYATSRLSGAVYSIDPNNLANAQVLIPAGKLSGPDGLTSDGMGDLFIAVQGDSRIYEYDLITGVLTPETVVRGTIDDLAPASGLGSIPEPSGLLTISIGALVMIACGRWRRAPVDDKSLRKTGGERGTGGAEGGHPHCRIRPCDPPRSSTTRPWTSASLTRPGRRSIL